MRLSLIVLALICFGIETAFSQYISTESTNTSTGDIYHLSGRIGIGTNTPLGDLHVQGGNILLRNNNSVSLHFRTDSQNSYISSKNNFVGNGSSANGNLIIISQNDISFRTGSAGSVGTPRMNINNDGNVGIGLENPSSKLHVAGSGGAGNNTANFDNTYVAISDNFIDNRPVSIRRHNSSAESMNIFLQDNSTIFSYNNDERSSQVKFKLTNNDVGNGGASANDNYVLTLNGNNNGGSVSIGFEPAPSGYTLSVDGKAIMEEVVVQLSSEWPDYVFKSDYQLATLEEVKKHIDEKGHLPNIPSAKEVNENGISLGEMNRLLLEKVEELTLHIIKQQEEINQLKESINK